MGDQVFPETVIKMNQNMQVAINLKDDGYSWHWVVFVRGKRSDYVLDPKPTIKANRRIDFSRMNPFAYLPVRDEDQQ